jgi:methane/ammonia monooxygenase subunit B
MKGTAMADLLCKLSRSIAVVPLAFFALLLSVEALAHGERAQEPYLRTRTVQFYDVQFDRATVAVNEEFTITGRFRLMQDWPDAVSLPDTVYMSAYSPGPVITRVESFVNDVPARQSFADLQLGRDYGFRLVLKGRVPGRHHIHPMLSVKGSGPLVGPGIWVEVTGSRADFRHEVKTMTGETIDNLEDYGVSRALGWYGVWIALAAAWLAFWLVRPLLIPRWIVLNKGREDLLVSRRDLMVGIGLGVTVIALTLGGYAYARKSYPYVVPLQAGTSKVEPLPLQNSNVQVKVVDATYDVPGRAMRIKARITNTGTEPIQILEFSTANLRFINPQAPGADRAVLKGSPTDTIARGGLVLSDATPLGASETREVMLEASDVLWELERLVSFLTDVDSKFGGLLFTVSPSGERQFTEIGGPILPTFTRI